MALDIVIHNMFIKIFQKYEWILSSPINRPYKISIIWKLHWIKTWLSNQLIQLSINPLRIFFMYSFNILYNISLRALWSSYSYNRKNPAKMSGSTFAICGTNQIYHISTGLSSSVDVTLQELFSTYSKVFVATHLPSTVTVGQSEHATSSSENSFPTNPNQFNPFCGCKGTRISFKIYGFHPTQSGSMYRKF